MNSPPFQASGKARPHLRNFRPDLLIEWVPIHILQCEPVQLREHSERQIKQIGRSISAFGFLIPILADDNGKVLAGVGRLHAARKIGMPEVPVIRVSHLTESEKRAFQIADNRLTEHAKWNDRLLAETLKDLSALELDFSLEVTGFSTAEIDLRIEGLSAAVADAPDPADQVPEPVGQVPVSSLGDLWQLGRHRLLCGNALELHAFEILMQGAQADVVFIDPPYNVRVDGHASGLGATHHREFAMASGEMSAAQYTSFLALVLTALARHSADGAILFSCMDWRHLSELLTAGRMSNLRLKNICVWVKHNAGMGSFYRSQYENIVVFKAGRGQHRNNIELGRHGRHRSNVWSYPAANNFGRATDEGHLLGLHPTPKPVRLVGDAILDCSARGELVLDNFLGSGTTLIAAERTGRRCYGMEIDPLYVDTAIRRWQAYTGDHAVHAISGKRFDEIAAARETGHD
jgi:DNA modification methylase